jgi:membrane-bound lytic murein transglycosylase A
LLPCFVPALNLLHLFVCRAERDLSDRRVEVWIRPSMLSLLGSGAVAYMLTACAAPQATSPASAPIVRTAPEPLAATSAAPAPALPATTQPVRVAAERPTSLAPTAATGPAETRTRHATFKRASFDELPGWEQDDLVAGWPAFRSSCAALQRRESWREVCAQSSSVPRTPAGIRSFFESRFALMRILNTDASRDGDITGYFEPLLEGRRQPEGAFNVPVLGVPRDLYTLDWINVPAPQRRGIVQVRPQGAGLVVLPGAEPGSVALDLRRFELDTKDRRLRVRVSRDGTSLRAEPYPTRGELTALGLPAGVDAPVLAWVNDALALYAMQVQGSGRIRLGDSTVMRVQYAEQNGHPFKPLRVVAKASERVVTRGIGDRAVAADEFVLEGQEGVDVAREADAGSEPAPDEVVTRGLSSRRAPSATGGQDAAANALVDELLGGKPKRAAAPASVPVSPAPTARPAPPPLPVSISAAPVRPSANAVSAVRPVASRPAVDPGVLASDPSYVFFKVAPDQTQGDGPPGALGVPLTAGRSVAVDPRVTPLGYPVFLAAPAPPGSNIDMRRLVFAQDTGGAIRGAVRADFFWGFGSDAGRLARGTRHRGQMWLLLPKAEAAKLGSSGVVTRGVSSAPRAAEECLIADEVFCQEPD